MTLFWIAFALHVTLTAAVFRLRLERLNRFFTVWLIGLLGFPVIELVLRWMHLRAAFQHVAVAYQVFSWILGAAAILYSLFRLSDPAQRVIAKGLTAMAFTTLVPRLLAGMGLVHAVDHRLNLLMNAAYLVPSLYMLWALIAARMRILDACDALMRRVLLRPNMGLRLADFLHDNRLGCYGKASVRGRDCERCIQTAKLLTQWLVGSHGQFGFQLTVGLCPGEKPTVNERAR